MLFFFIPVDRLIEFLLGERLHDFAAKGSGFRKSVEIAACMRAHFADGCIFALLNDKAVKMLPCHGKAFLPGRRIDNIAIFKVCIHFLEHPGISPGSTADGNRGASCFFQKRFSRWAVNDVPVSNDRNLNRLDDFGNLLPVRLSCIEIFPCASMDSNGCCPCLFDSPGKFHAVFRIP